MTREQIKLKRRMRTVSAKMDVLRQEMEQLLQRFEAIGLKAATD